MNDEYNPKEVYKHVLAVETASNAIRSVLAEKVLDMPDRHRLSVARDVCRSLLRGSSAFKDMGLEGKHARGCVAEILLEYIFKVWLEDYHIPGQVISNVMLPVYPRTPERKETTQLDILCLTDKAVFICECKSYAGNKTTDGDVIITKDAELYPWKQNHGHIVALKNNLTYVLQGLVLPEIYNVVYFFADGKFTEWKQPDEDHDILLVNYGCLATLNKIYNNITDDRQVLSRENINAMAEYCRDLIPSVEEQADHILRLKKIT